MPTHPHAHFALFALLSAFLSNTPSWAAHSERGFRQIEVYSGRDMEGGAQNFSVAQDPMGTLYVGNLHGVLEYDGAFCRLIELPTQTAVMFVECSHTGVVIAGGYNQIGYLAKDHFNQTRFHSIKNLIPEPHRDFGDVDGIFPIQDRVYVLTTKVLLTWCLENQKIQCAPRTPEMHLFYHQDGLYLAQGGTVEVLSPSQEAQSIPQNDRIFFSLGHHGYILSDGTIQRNEGALDTSFLENWLHNVRITSVKILDQNRILIASRDKGIVIVDEHLQEDESLNIYSGLPDNDVRDVHISDDGIMWIALNTGLAAIDMASPVFVFDQRHGLETQVNCMTRYRGKLFLGTSGGLYYLESRGNESTDRQPHLQVLRKGDHRTGIWDLLATNSDELVIGTSNGVLLLSQDTVEAVPETKDLVVYHLGRCPRSGEIVFLGAREGLGVLKRIHDGWQFAGLISRSPPQIRAIQQAPDGSVWVGTTFDGAWRIANLFDQEQNINPDATLQQIDEGEINLFWFQDDLCFTKLGRVHLLDRSGTSLIPHPTLTPDIILPDFFVAFHDAVGNYWFNTDPLTRITVEENGELSVDNHTYRNVPAFDIQNFYSEPDGAVWLTPQYGLVKIEPHSQFSGSPCFDPEIAHVTCGSEPLPIRNGNSLPELRYALNRMRIEFSPHDFRLNPQYQYRMDPIDVNWSDWSTRPFVEYTNLWEGSYHFRMRTKRPGGLTSPETSFSFKIHPPWFRSWIAYVLYFLMLFGVILGFARWRSARLQKHAELLRRTVRKQTKQLKEVLKDLESAKIQVEEKNEELREKNQVLSELSMLDGLTGIANRRRMDEFLAEEWKRAWRLNTPTSAILLDLDLFKMLNDQLGHLEGDVCLKNIAQYLKGVKLRSSDLVARYGGEEFVIILPNCEITGAEALAEDMRTGIEALNLKHPDSPFGRVTASFGVASMLANGDNHPSDLLSAADDALYRAKSTGRNCLVSNSPTA